MIGGEGNDTYYVDKFSFSTCGNGKGNEGVGNGEDPPPPGHDTNWNDGSGTSPGNPGSKGGAKGWGTQSDDHSGSFGGDHGDDGASCGAGGPVCTSRDDQVVEAASEGWDTVFSTVSYVLPENVEALRLQGCYGLQGEGNELGNWLVGNDAANTLDGAAGDDLLSGGGGNDCLNGGVGNDVLEGQSGNDTLVGGDGNDALLGGRGTDLLDAGSGRAFVAGGSESDVILLGDGPAVVGFNRGDGADRIKARTGTSVVLSLGGGIGMEDIALRRRGSDLVIDAGANDTVTFSQWYAGSSNRPDLEIQVVTEASATYDPAGDPLHDTKVTWLDGQKLVEAFDASRRRSSPYSRWEIMNSALDAHLGGSDSAALGGDLAYQYGSSGTLAGMGLDPAAAALADTQFGMQAQALHGVAQTQTGHARILS
jgi:Ca2+-binding RTX toxin-like protein